MLRILLNGFKKIVTLLILASMIIAAFTSTVRADDQYIKYEIITEAARVEQVRNCEVVVRVGEYQGKSGKRIYVNNQTLNIPNDIPIRNDNDGQGFYISEWDINLKEGKALVEKLKANGVNAVLQVSYDKSTDLNAAGRIANKSNPYLYVSLHHNSYDTNSNGYFAMYNPHDKLSEHVANRLANSIQYNGMVSQRSNQSNTGYIGEMNAIHPSTTPVLLELGFFSNPSELEVICSDQYVNYVSNKLANEITNILNTEYR